MLLRDGPTVEVTALIEGTTVEAVWAAVTDISLSARFSPELQRAEWSDGPAATPGVAVGNTFHGTNRNERFGEWTTTCEVVEVDEGRRWVWQVTNPGAEPGASWAFEVEPAGTGVLVRHWARMGPGRSGVTILVAQMPGKEALIVSERLKQWRAGMTATLDGVRAEIRGGAQ